MINTSELYVLWQYAANRQKELHPYKDGLDNLVELVTKLIYCITEILSTIDSTSSDLQERSERYRENGTWWANMRKQYQEFFQEALKIGIHAYFEHSEERLLREAAKCRDEISKLEICKESFKQKLQKETEILSLLQYIQSHPELKAGCDQIFITIWKEQLDFLNVLEISRKAEDGLLSTQLNEVQKRVCQYLDYSYLESRIKSLGKQLTSLRDDKRRYYEQQERYRNADSLVDTLKNITKTFRDRLDSGVAIDYEEARELGWYANKMMYAGEWKSAISNANYQIRNPFPCPDHDREDYKKIVFDIKLEQEELARKKKLNKEVCEAYKQLKSLVPQKVLDSTANN